MLDISGIRREYRDTPLSISRVKKCPFAQFQIWLDAAVHSEILEPTAMALATASSAGRPSLRTVLLKGLDRNGLRFYTNYASRKAHEIEENPHVAATLLWQPLERQLTVEGIVEREAREQSEAYWQSRPRGNQLGSLTSHQGESVHNRAELEAHYQQTEEKFREQQIPCPDYWGGYVIIPCRFEFWQGRPHRLHDRIEYRLEKGEWTVRRLAP